MNTLYTIFATILLFVLYFGYPLSIVIRVKELPTSLPLWKAFGFFTVILILQFFSLGCYLEFINL